MHTLHELNTAIETLGPAKIPSPLPFGRFIQDSKQLPIHISQEVLDEAPDEPMSFEFTEAGPRDKIYFDPSKTKCAIVTCGGLCPGINDVIRSIVLAAHHNYGLASIVGIRYGLEGFCPQYGHETVELTPRVVSDIHEFGGTMLGSSRGHQSAEEIVDALERMNINILFMIGGDGTMKAASKIVEEIKDRGLKISVIGVPKTIDNDIYFVTNSFGFTTAVSKATEAIRCAHTEANGAPNGIGMVKLMGRESGFIAAEATLALKEVNFVLVPEDEFDLHGPNGFLASLEQRIKDRGHAVVVVAEGAGQNLCAVNGKSGATDASGNPVLCDICDLLRQEIKTHFDNAGLPFTLKFIDPSYIIRSVPADPGDRVYCGFLGQHAVHAAMSGKTNMVVSRLQDNFVYLPLSLVTQKRRKLNINSNYWRAVLESTGQPIQMRNA
ncbi:ATP-dependent 6-phosphofructokinase [Desulfohalobium retbaense]|uniref:ATP-dependent 6-phosphofructokinase n=1 Tax=Desulfohalobium retbaense (strain ATCC 49708 / DSM 5692 / JCM 16813 / HR100) TaxID=485915 RepID=C8X4C4_DESRD|nr:ATP-dependent 6-phosphofructokinase [Desulfohalobium retbaense]ACV69398.1 6-phosphofructokinase [Desulfohalobium retbaense DSM 5692]